ncbi:tRNA/rRNA methyltransferase SpoU [Neofusicoccum parvum]|uniref:tRNA/rRNA methyltransferase SpoU n=1 Tax=Neofusicoccum parvum TaxID=310453 RepID=A0ACB5S7T5_9PEZI|nr:tRNA/rRNA methyltransferase SpoU [Neofusicoccum parvum]
MASSSAESLARLFLARLPPAEQPAAVDAVIADLCARTSAGAVDLPSAFLSAELLQKCPETREKHASVARLGRVLMAIISTSAQDSIPPDLVQLCARHEPLANHVFTEAAALLAQSAARLRDADALAVPTSAIPWKQSPATPDEALTTDSHIDRMVLHLTFLKLFLWSEASCTISINLLQALLALLGARSEKLAHASQDCLSAAFHSLQSAKANIERKHGGGFDVFGEVTVPIGELIWSRIADILSAPADLGLGPSAFHVWFRWFALEGDVGPSRSILKQHPYWTFLQLGLREGFSEQRKFCLHILRASIRFTMAYPEDLHPYVAGASQPGFEMDYTRYCTLFETIILGRYINQVEECMPDLANLAWRSSGLAEVARDFSTAAASVLLEEAVTRHSEILDKTPGYNVLKQRWTELRSQDGVELAETGVFYHPACLRVASEDTHALLARALSEFQTFSEGRIYVFPPLVKALRRAYFQVPEVVSFLPLEDFIVRFADRPPTAKLEFLIEAAVAEKLAAIVSHRTYASYYGPGESQGYAAMFDLLNRIRASDHVFAKRVFDQVLRPWVKQKVPIPMVSKWKATTQVQTMLLLSQTCLSAASKEEVADYLRKFTKVLSLEPLPRYRFLWEWIIVRIYVREPEQRRELVEILGSDDHTNPKHVASVMKMAVMAARLPDTDEAFAHRLMTLLIPLSASPKIVIRHEAQWSFPPLWDHAEANGWTKITENPAFSALNTHIRSLDKYSTPPPQRTLEWLDPIKDNNLALLFGGRYLDFDPAEARVVSMEDFKAVWAEDEQEAGERYPPAQIPLGTDKVAAQAMSSTDESKSDFSIVPATDAPAIPLQTKGMAWQEALLASPAAALARPSTPLILIGSLIDNAYNLGGLSRAAEIFGCASMYMRSLDTLKHKDFTSVSVSSHSHIPIHSLPPAELPEFLRAMKAEGYKVVGVEQTDRSLVLGAEDSVLPEKCVLVMGSEREGIPGTVLAECDICVEVRQVGVTRSLNVQTAAAIVLYEYQRQHCGK